MKNIRIAPFTKPIFATKWLSWIPLVEIEINRDFSKIKHRIMIMFSDTKVLNFLWWKERGFEFRKEWK